MKCSIKFDALHPSYIVEVAEKEENWRLNISGKYLYKLNTVSEHIEIYFGVYYKSEEKIPFVDYMTILPGFENKSSTEKYLNIGTLIDHTVFVSIKKLFNYQKRYVIQSVLNIDSVNYEVYIILDKHGAFDESYFSYSRRLMRKIINRLKRKFI